MPSELEAARENLAYAKREYNAGRISLNALDGAKARLDRAEGADCECPYPGLTARDCPIHGEHA